MRYPVAFIFLNVNPETIDVNIHPNKKEVRFHDEDAIVKIIENATVEALASQDAVIEVRDYFSTEPSTNDAKKEDKSEQVDIKHILKSKSEKKQVDLKREKILWNYFIVELIFFDKKTVNKTSLDRKSVV